MDRYWSYVATPLFFVTIAAGVFTLFVTDDIHVVDKGDISKTVALIRKAASGPDPAPAPAPAPPSKVATPARPGLAALGKGLLGLAGLRLGSKVPGAPKYPPAGPQPRSASTPPRSASTPPRAPSPPPRAPSPKAQGRRTSLGFGSSATTGRGATR